MSQASAGLGEDPGRALGGYARVLTAATLWGSSGIFAVYLFDLGLTPDAVAILRPAVALVFLLVMAWHMKGLVVPRAGLAWIAGAGGLATGVFQFAYQRSVDAVGVPVTVALLYLSPAMVVLASGPLLDEWPGARRIFFAATSVVGVWLTVLGATGVVWRGGPSDTIWGVAAAAAYGTYTMVGRHTSPRWGASATALYSTVGGVAFLAVAFALTDTHVPLPRSAAVWGLVVAFAFLTIALAAWLFYGALERLEAGSVSIASTVEPVAAAVLATVLLGQGLTLRGWIGLGLVIAGVIGAYRTDASTVPAAPV